MILCLSTQFAYAKLCHLFSVTFIFCFQKFCHSAFILKPHLEDFSRFRVLPQQHANTEFPHESTASEFSQEHFKQDAEQIPENNLLSISVLYNQMIHWFSSEKLKTSGWSDDLCSTCHAFSSDLPPLYQYMLCQLITQWFVVATLKSWKLVTYVRKLGRKLQTASHIH